mgnify:CR=1 FL=1
MAGTGAYDLAKDQLERMRRAIDEEHRGVELEEALEAATSSGVELRGDALKTAPRGFPKDHPRIELLRLKQVLLMHPLPRGKAVDRAPFDHALETWRAAKPGVDWMSAHVGDSEIPPEARFGRGR